MEHHGPTWGRSLKLGFLRSPRPPQSTIGGLPRPWTPVHFWLAVSPRVLTSLSETLVTPPGVHSILECIYSLIRQTITCTMYRIPRGQSDQRGDRVLQEPTAWWAETHSSMCIETGGPQVRRHGGEDGCQLEGARGRRLGVILRKACGGGTGEPWKTVRSLLSPAVLWRGLLQMAEGTRTSGCGSGGDHALSSLARLALRRNISLSDAHRDGVASHHCSRSATPDVWKELCFPPRVELPIIRAAENSDSFLSPQ